MGVVKKYPGENRFGVRFKTCVIERLDSRAAFHDNLLAESKRREPPELEATQGPAAGQILPPVRVAVKITQLFDCGVQ